MLWLLFSQAGIEKEAFYPSLRFEISRGAEHIALLAFTKDDGAVWERPRDRLAGLLT